MMISKKPKKLKFWTHKKYPGKKFKATRPKDDCFTLTYSGPRGGSMIDRYYSWQDAKAAGWRKCK